MGLMVGTPTCMICTRPEDQMGQLHTNPAVPGAWLCERCVDDIHSIGDFEHDAVADPIPAAENDYRPCSWCRRRLRAIPTSHVACNGGVNICLECACALRHPNQSHTDT